MYKLTKTKRKELQRNAKFNKVDQEKTAKCERGAAKILGLVSSNIHSGIDRG